MNALDHSSGLWKPEAARTRGEWRRKNQSRNIRPRTNAPQKSIHFAAMVSPETMKTTPVRYAQNMPEPGIQAGIRLAMKRGMRKWLTPKTTEEIAKTYGPDPIKALTT